MAPRRQGQDWYPLRGLSPDLSIYLGENADGDLLFRTDLSFVGRHGTCEHLTERYLIALGLTEVCCNGGMGKVYYFPMPTTTGFSHAKKTSNDKTTSVYLYTRLPKLIYVPLVRGKKDQKEWREMSFAVRHSLLNARSGGIMRKECVMPIDLTYEDVEKEEIRLNGYNSADSGTKALLAIVPKAYLGWCSELQEKPRGFAMLGPNMEDGLGAWFVAGDETLKKYRQGSADDVVGKLWNMYYQGEPRSLVKFERIFEGLIEFHTA